MCLLLRRKFGYKFRRQFEGANGVFLLIPDAQRRAAGHEYFQMVCGSQQLRDEGRRRDYLLKVVEHQQRMLLDQGTQQQRQRCHSCFVPKAAHNCGRHKLRVVDGSKIDKCRAVGKSGAQIGGGLQRQACLADAAGPVSVSSRVSPCASSARSSASSPPADQRARCRRK